MCVCAIIFCLPCRGIFIYLYLQNHFGSQLTEESAEARHFEVEQLRAARSSVHDLAQRILAYFANGNVREIAHLDDCSDEGRLPFQSIVSEFFCCALGGGVISIEGLVGSQQAVEVCQVFVVLVVEIQRTNYVQILAEVRICSWLRTLALELGS